MHFGITFNPSYTAYNRTSQANNFRKIGFGNEQKKDPKEELMGDSKNYDTETDRTRACSRKQNPEGINSRDNRYVPDHSSKNDFGPY